MKAKVGPVSATFQAELELGDLNPPESYTIKGGVKGGAAGFAKGDANVSLTEVDSDNTRLTYQVKASVGGKLAQVGSRLVDGAARKMADEFFAAFRDHLVGPSSSERVRVWVSKPQPLILHQILARQHRQMYLPNKQRSMRRSINLDTNHQVVARFGLLLLWY